MATMGSDFLPFVQRCQVRPSQDEEFLLGAEHALSGHRCEWAAPVDHLPGDLVDGAASLELPDVGAQDRLALVPWVVKGLGVVPVGVCF